MSPAPPRRPLAYDFSLWYCPEDDGVAARLAERLAQEGFRGYAEHRDRVAGASLVRTASEALEASRVAILLLSPASLRDPWCQRLAQWSLHGTLRRRGTKVIPVLLGVEKAAVPPCLQHLTQLEFHAEFFFDRLVGSLRRSCSAPGGARPAPASGAGS